MSSFEPPTARRFALRQLALMQERGLSQRKAYDIVSGLLRPPAPRFLLHARPGLLRRGLVCLWEAQGCVDLALGRRLLIGRNAAEGLMLKL